MPPIRSTTRGSRGASLQRLTRARADFAGRRGRGQRRRRRRAHVCRVCQCARGLVGLDDAGLRPLYILHKHDHTVHEQRGKTLFRTIPHSTDTCNGKHRRRTDSLHRRWGEDGRGSARTAGPDWGITHSEDFRAGNEPLHYTHLRRSSNCTTVTSNCSSRRIPGGGWAAQISAKLNCKHITSIHATLRVSLVFPL